ncbi:hypothetical protein ONZ45_g415 [Pleurotus djamor]|nr:hypothetical protein ONZ45_g415 [Pleurotus djamor]
MSGPYEAALDAEKQEIRAITLHPGEPGTTIVCSFDVVSLVDNPPYEALSYVWGDASVVREIIFGGRTWPVTSNLFVALQYLRSNEESRVVWIDALCINQNDVKERNEQVRIMGEIYQKARQVLIWLGEAEEEEEEMIALVKRISMKREMSEEDGKALMSFCSELAQKQWFTRLWTVQELALASHDPLVGCGHQWVHWQTLWEVWNRAANALFPDMDLVMGGPVSPSKEDSEEDARARTRPYSIKLDLLYNTRNAITKNGGDSLRDLLVDTQRNKVTEPRDRVFALRGMMHKSDRDEITVDYGRPVGIVYAEAMAHLFNKSQGPLFLSGIQLLGESWGPSAPSWTPRFGSDELLHPTQLHPPGVGVSGVGRNCDNGLVSKDMKTLSVRGMYIDQVFEKLTFGKTGECLGQLLAVEALVQKARELASSSSSHRPYLSQFKSKEPVWRTLIANKGYRGATREEAPESYGDVYQQFLGGRMEGVDEYGSPARDYKLSLLVRLPNKCFFVTKTGFYGMAPDFLREGDHLVIWFGAPTPFVLRKMGDVWIVLGVAYVAGIMDGEMVDEIYCEDLEDDEMFVCH